MSISKRTVYQDNGCIVILCDLNDVLVVLDWTTKYLPQVYSEKMKDLFGQKDVHWHVCVSVFKD